MVGFMQVLRGFPGCTQSTDHDMICFWCLTLNFMASVEGGVMQSKKNLHFTHKMLQISVM